MEGKNQNNMTKELGLQNNGQLHLYWIKLLYFTS